MTRPLELALYMYFSPQVFIGNDVCLGLAQRPASLLSRFLHQYTETSWLRTLTIWLRPIAPQTIKATGRDTWRRLSCISVVIPKYNSSQRLSEGKDSFLTAGLCSH